MDMFFELHGEGSVGYKKLSEADLGTSISSHQTHIGLSEKSLTFLSNRDIIGNSIFIYEDSFDYMDAYFDRIENPDGTYRSPKIKIGGVGAVSITSHIREIARKNFSSTLFLFWFALKNEVLVFFLVKNNSEDYRAINALGLNLDNIKAGTKVLDSTLKTNFISFLESKINKNGIFVLKELEIASQINEFQGTKKFKKYDLERAEAIFREIGRNGETLINRFLYNSKTKSEISGFNWLNQEKESGLPYDFIIQELNGNLIYLDVKATNYDFEQKMIFSSQELDFISSSKNDYHVYRVYSINNSHFLRICDNYKNIATKISPLTQNYKESLLNFETKLVTAKFAISPKNEELKFRPEVKLIV